MQVKTKRTISSPRWSHCVPTIPVGSIVELNKKDRTVKHPTHDGISILLNGQENLKDYFEGV